MRNNSEVRERSSRRRPSMQRFHVWWSAFSSQWLILKVADASNCCKQRLFSSVASKQCKDCTKTTYKSHQRSVHIPIRICLSWNRFCFCSFQMTRSWRSTYGTLGLLDWIWSRVVGLYLRIGIWMSTCNPFDEVELCKNQSRFIIRFDKAVFLVSCEIIQIVYHTQDIQHTQRDSVPYLFNNTLMRSI